MSVTGNIAIEFTEEQAMLMDVARSFCQEKAPMDVVRGQLEQDAGFDAAVWREMAELGWTGIALPESVGGSAMGIGTLVPVVEALGKSLLGTPLISTSLAGQLLARADVNAASAFLERIAGGEAAAVALLESADWGASNVALTCDDAGMLAGSKRFVEDAQSAEIFVVVASKAGSTVLAVVERSALSAAAIKPNHTIDLTKRCATVDFTGVSAACVIEGDAVEDALRDYRLFGALLVAAESTGAASAALDYTVEYLKTRKQFGKLIGSYQGLKHPATNMLCDIESSRSLVYNAATIVNDGPLSTDAEIACRMAKSFASDLMIHVGDRSVQFHGGFGFTWDCDSTLYIRRGQWARSVFGDAKHHRKVLGRLLLDSFL